MWRTYSPCLPWTVATPRSSAGAAPATSKKPAAVDTHPEKEAKSEAAQNTQDDTKVQIIDGGESASSEEDLVE